MTDADTRRPRAADDFDAIRSRRDQLRDENVDTGTPARAYARVDANPCFIPIFRSVAEHFWVHDGGSLVYDAGPHPAAGVFERPADRLPTPEPARREQRAADLYSASSLALLSRAPAASRDTVVLNRDARLWTFRCWEKRRELCVRGGPHLYLSPSAARDAAGEFAGNRGWFIPRWHEIQNDGLVTKYYCTCRAGDWMVEVFSLRLVP